MFSRYVVQHKIRQQFFLAEYLFSDAADVCEGFICLPSRLSKVASQCSDLLFAIMLIKIIEKRDRISRQIVTVSGKQHRQCA